jgi:rhomboid protease GluP
MELDVAITILMVGTALLSLRVAIKSRARAWMLLQGANLAVLGAAWLFAPKHVAAIAGPLWAVSVLLPGLATTLAERYSRAERYGVAYALSTIAALLHPTEAMKLRLLVTTVQRADRAGRREEADAALERLAQHPAGLTLATLLRFRFDQKWAETREWIEAAPGLVRADPVALSFYVRALGEIGDVEALCRVIEDTRTAPAFHQVEDQILLFAAAFSGRAKTTALVLERRHADMPDDLRRYFELAAAHAAGEDVDAALRALGESAHPRLARAALARIDAPPAPPLSGEARRTLDALDESVRALEPARAVRPTVTTPIVLVNLYVFAREAPGGVTDIVNLYGLGALSLGGFQTAEWYRLFTATVLHYGVAHVAMNMVGVLLFGPQLEASIGRARALAIYVVSGVVANVVAVLWTKHTGAQGAVLVGASGCAMGIIGALLVRRIAAWRRRRTPLAQAGVRSLLGIFALQIVFDAVTPRVAGSVHLLGAAAGALLALALGAPRWRDIGPRPRGVRKRARAAVALGVLASVALLEVAFAKTSAGPRDLGACEDGDTEACARVCYDRDDRWMARCQRLARSLATAPRPTADDERRAFVIFRATCDAGDLYGCTSAAVMTFNGQGTARDEEAARRAWIAGCDAGESAACEILQNQLSH